MPGSISRRRYDVNTEPHRHAVCRQCRRIVDVRGDEIGGGERLRQALEQVDLSAREFLMERRVFVEEYGKDHRPDESP